MTRPSSLGRGLGRGIATATIIGMIVFAIVLTVAIYISEDGEECAPGVPEDPPAEIIAQCAVALAFAAPVGLGLSLFIGKRLTHGTTDCLDEVIENASRMTGERLEERLPVSVAADPLDRLSTAINGTLDRIQTGVTAQRQFAADASHELRTPLTVISTNLEVARRKPRDAAHWEHVVDSTLAEVKRMHALMDKLLELSRAGAAGLHYDRRDLKTLAEVAVERALPLAEARAITLDVAGPESFARVDADAIGIVLDNLLRNAIDHSPDGQAVRVVVGPHAFAVEDRGAGVPIETRVRIFEPFARGVHRAADRAGSKGFGLGLAICKRIVDGHGGAIGVVDRDGGGARFEVTLPG